ncbi:hypothetical protein MDG893_18222 [Marinobacter algicola DG893]|uniref:Uncharacterized protein n=1 Tax=Marinobacter algicola DG893 TaxID=443152 RepID=A6EY97_9GAMM|nr:hypothetical protein MDG893_18222 [Marinobacter algicola DG893]
MIDNNAMGVFEGPNIHSELPGECKYHANIDRDEQEHWFAPLSLVIVGDSVAGGLCRAGA